jgi:two-component system response regulator MprA
VHTAACAPRTRAPCALRHSQRKPLDLFSSMPFSSTVPRVLVVDDDADVLAVLGELFAAEGFGVELARDGLDALVRFERGGPFDAIVCDLDMPRLDGTTLVRMLRRRGWRRVVVSLSGRFDLLATTADLGQVYALPKPVDAERLVAVLREAAEIRA